jgi:hypothetical protein
MTEHDELLARLDKRKAFYRDIFTNEPGKILRDKDCADAAAAIRSLQAQLEAADRAARITIREEEQRAETAEADLAKVEAATIERCLRLSYQENPWEAIRALAPDRTAVVQADSSASKVEKGGISPVSSVPTSTAAQQGEAAKRVLEAAIDDYKGKCTITSWNLVNATRTYLFLAPDRIAPELDDDAPPVDTLSRKEMNKYLDSRTMRIRTIAPDRTAAERYNAMMKERILTPVSAAATKEDGHE